MRPRDGEFDTTELTSLDTLERWAEATWPEPVRTMIQGGAGSGSSVRANVYAWSRWNVRNRILRDVSTIDTSTVLLGRQIRTPILVAPSGLHTIVRPEGEVLTAKGVRDFGSIMVLSSGTGRTVEDVCAVGARTWFQFYWGKDRGRVRENLQRAVAVGCEAVCLTADLPVPPTIDERMRSAVRNLPGPKPQYVLPRDAHLGGEWDHDARLTWRDLDWLRSVVDVPLVVKGITTGEDARQAADSGVDSIVVSNHGGRTLEHAVPTAICLTEVVAALRDVPSGPDILVDGGIRSGHDVLVALALGARAVFIGRPVLWGLAANGSTGVRDVLAMLERQLVTAMAIVGRPRLRDLVSSEVLRLA